MNLLKSQTVTLVEAHAHNRLYCLFTYWFFWHFWCLCALVCTPYVGNFWDLECTTLSSLSLVMVNSYHWASRTKLATGSRLYIISVRQRSSAVYCQDCFASLHWTASVFYYAKNLTGQCHQKIELQIDSIMSSHINCSRLNSALKKLSLHAHYNSLITILGMPTNDS